MLFKLSAAVILLALCSFTPSEAVGVDYAASIARANKRICEKNCAKEYIKARDNCVRDVCKTHPNFDDYHDFFLNMPKRTTPYTPCEKKCIKQGKDVQTKCDENC